MAGGTRTAGQRRRDPGPYPAPRQPSTQRKGEDMEFEESIRKAIAETQSNIELSSSPDWEPLERTLPAEQWAGFMWMGLAPGGICLYKHGITRRYLNLRLDPDGDLEAFRYSHGRYIP